MHFLPPDGIGIARDPRIDGAAYGRSGTSREFYMPCTGRRGRLRRRRSRRSGIGSPAAQLAASLTVKQIQGGITGPDDLPGKKVATTRGSTAVAFLRDINAQVVEEMRIDDAYKALTDQDVDAVVFDAPVLQYYAANQGKGRVQVVGALFRKEDYGIVFPPGSPLRKRVNDALLALREEPALTCLKCR